MEGSICLKMEFNPPPFFTIKHGRVLGYRAYTLREKNSSSSQETQVRFECKWIRLSIR